MHLCCVCASKFAPEDRRRRDLNLVPNYSSNIKGLSVAYFLLSTHALFTILTCAHRMRVHSCPQHWPLCFLGLYQLKFEFVRRLTV